MQQLIRWLICAGMTVGAAAPVVAAEWKTEELLEIASKSSEAYAKAFKEGDAGALVKLFTEDAEYIDGSGVVFHGREAIEQEHAAYFESAPKGELTVEMTSIRPIAATVVVEEGISRFQPADDGPVSIVSYVATHVKQEDGTWKLASVRELTEPMLAPHEQLKKLTWLVGSWRDESADDVVHIQWDWSDDGNFLLASFQTHSAAGKSTEGTHRIGWDSQKKQFRSWIFSSSGTFAEGCWTEIDGAWDINLTATLPDGSAASQILRFERDGQDAIQVSQMQRQVGGSPLDNVRTRIVRMPPTPGSLSAAEPK